MHTCAFLSTLLILQLLCIGEERGRFSGLSLVDESGRSAGYRFSPPPLGTASIGSLNFLGGDLKWVDMNASRTGGSETVYSELTDLRLHKRTILQTSGLGSKPDILSASMKRPFCARKRPAQTLPPSGHSIFRMASRTTLPHFSISSLMRREADLVLKQQRYCRLSTAASRRHACVRSGLVVNNYSTDSKLTKTSPAMISGSPRMNKVMQACSNKLQYFVVRRIGAFAVLEYHHSDTDAFAPIQYIIRSESGRFPQDPTDAAFGAASSIRNRTNLGVLSNEHVHRATVRLSFSPTHQSISGRPLLD
jgi:hypothetical protein